MSSVSFETSGKPLCEHGSAREASGSSRPVRPGLTAKDLKTGYVTSIAQVPIAKTWTRKLDHPHPAGPSGLAGIRRLE